MNLDTLSQMSVVTEAIFQREFSAIQGILKEESALRQSLAQLDAQSQSTKTSYAQEYALKTVGADILWRAWISKTRRQLNIELAQVMAKKIEAMVHVRKAFGQKEAAKNLMETARDEQRRKVIRRQTEQLSIFY